MMHEDFIISSRDTVLIAIPFVFILFVCVFRLDSVFAMPKRVISRQRPASGLDQDGECILTDPDGRVVRRRFGSRESR
jgi:hypothetical protein